MIPPNRPWKITGVREQYHMEYLATRLVYEGWVGHSGGQMSYAMLVDQEVMRSAVLQRVADHALAIAKCKFAEAARRPIL